MSAAISTEDDTVRCGQERYEREIRAAVEPQQDGRFLALDVDSGRYELADDSLTALDRLLANIPDARAYILRVGWPTAVRIGAGRNAGPS